MPDRCFRNALLAVLTACVAAPAPACTTIFFRQDGTMLFARNYDWHLEDGIVVVNKRGMAKRAFSVDNSAEWTSRYGSVTFNQYGREFPCDGMNERGLVAAMLWLDATRYPDADERPAVTSAQWVQYQLDTAATVEEVIANCKKTRVTPIAGVPVHYLVADATGACASIEYLDGRLVVHTGEDLAAPALTNTAYARAKELLRGHEGFGGEAPVRRTWSSVDRFVGAARLAKQIEAGDTPLTAEFAFASLKRVAQGERTQWSIVYGVSDGVIRFRTQLAPEMKVIELDTLDFSPDGPALAVDVSTQEGGEINGRLDELTLDENRRAVDAAFDGTFFLRVMPESVRTMIARYPFDLCRPATPAASGVEP